MSEVPDGLKCSAEYRTTLFDASTIDGLLASFGVLLNSIVRISEARVSRLPILTDTERYHIVADWNTVATQGDYECCVHELVEAQVRRTPSAVAVVAEAGSVTYSGLNARANRLARDLSARGVGPDVLVAICLERSPDLVVALLAVLKAGGAYVPLDPDYPADRLAFMLADSGATVLVTAPNLVDRLPQHSVTTIHVHSAYWNHPSHDGDEYDTPNRCTPEDLAYVMYTSGSTGRPKGAMNTHRGVCNFLLRSCEVHGFAPADVILQKTPISFDPSVWEIFGSLISGARLVLARPRDHADPGYLASVIADHGVTVLNVVPSMLQVLLEMPDIQQQGTPLRIVVCGGETLSLALQNRFFSLTAALHNAYGPTEAAVNTCDWACERGSTRNTVPLGRPLPNVQVYILDVAREPAPIGVAGELHIGGVGVGRGYLKRPQLTTDHFVPDPFSANVHSRMYRTGDICRFRSDGVIEYLGRRDYQLKLRGVRVELGEIETVLAAHPGVREVVVIAREDPLEDIRLVAYVVPHAGVQLSESALRAYLQGILITQMIPSAVVLLEALPLTPNGKLDRGKLPVPTTRARLDQSEHVAPRTPTEKAIARTWGDLLRCKHVGVHDNFFELGGHSLVAMRIVSRAQMLGIQLSVRSVFELPTVAQLAALVDGRTLSDASSPTQPAITRVARAAYRRPSAL